MILYTSDEESIDKSRIHGKITDSKIINVSTEGDKFAIMINIYINHIIGTSATENTVWHPVFRRPKESL